MCMVSKCFNTTFVYVFVKVNQYGHRNLMEEKSP